MTVHTQVDYYSVLDISKRLPPKIELRGSKSMLQYFLTSQWTWKNIHGQNNVF
jgi:hypothetical protein